MASHNNCRAGAGRSAVFRRSIRRLIQRRAVIGVVCDAWMLKPDWQIGSSTPEGLTMLALVDQIDHICQLAGNAGHVGIGSDLDGGYGTEQTPSDLKTIADLRRLEPLLAERVTRPPTSTRFSTETGWNSSGEICQLSPRPPPGDCPKAAQRSEAAWDVPLPPVLLPGPPPSEVDPASCRPNSPK